MTVLVASTRISFGRVKEMCARVVQMYGTTVRKEPSRESAKLGGAGRSPAFATTSGGSGVCELQLALVLRPGRSPARVRGERSAGCPPRPASVRPMPDWLRFALLSGHRKFAGPDQSQTRSCGHAGPGHS